ncbi:RDD family protein [Actinocorallia lasiicapitis]
MTQPPQDPQNPWENPGGGTNPPPGTPPNPYGGNREDPFGQNPADPYGQAGQPGQTGGPPIPPHGGHGPSFSKDQPPPYGGQGGQDPFGAPQNPYGQQPPGGGYTPGGVPPYSGGQDPYGQHYGGSPMIASKWKRLVGIIIDNVIFWVIACCLAMPFGGANTDEFIVENPDGTTSYEWTELYSTGQMIANLIGAVLVFLYFWLVTTRWNGQTLGKKAMNIRVVREDTGGPIDSKQGVIRSAVFVLLAWICSCGGLIDAIWIFTNPKNQTLHDKAAKTVVVDAVGPNPYAQGGYGPSGQSY